MQGRIILTRSQKRNDAWADQLHQRGYAFHLLPLTEHRPLAWSSTFNGDLYDWLIFTSPTGAEHFTAAGLTPDKWRVAALGAGTQAALNEASWAVDFAPSARDGAELAAAFVAAHPAPNRVLLPGPKERLAEPRATLLANGYSVTDLALYETHNLVTSGALQANDIVFFCSPSAVRSFVSHRSERPACVAIGATTAAICRAEKFPTQVAKTPDLDAMIFASGVSS